MKVKINIDCYITELKKIKHVRRLRMLIKKGIKSDRIIRYAINKYNAHYELTV